MVELFGLGAASEVKQSSAASGDFSAGAAAGVGNSLPAGTAGLSSSGVTFKVEVATAVNFRRSTGGNIGGAIIAIMMLESEGSGVSDGVASPAGAAWAFGSVEVVTVSLFAELALPFPGETWFSALSASFGLVEAFDAGLAPGAF